MTSVENFNKIESFSAVHPAANAVYGYGSSVFKQTNHEGYKSLIDVIFVVPNLKEWHKENLRLNPKDYSFSGKCHIALSTNSFLKGPNGITYYSGIQFGEDRYKYGVIEKKDFIRNLKAWDTFFIAGRFQKPTLEIKSDDEIREALSDNLKNAFLIGSILSDEETDIFDLCNNIVKLSYIGDQRMHFAEDPDKVRNIVYGSISELVKLYLNYIPEYISIDAKGRIKIDKQELRYHVKEIPIEILYYLTKHNYDITNETDLQIGIVRFFQHKNAIESRNQIIEGLKTNGIIRSVPYTLHKIEKFIKGRSK